MKNSEKFEIAAADYLTRTFSKYANFFHEGGNDSTVSDIKVLTNEGKGFYIEVKEAISQSGQFVLFPNIEEREFI